MPGLAEAPHTRAIRIDEWVTPTGATLGVSGDLDAMACRAFEQRLRRLLARFPGMLLTIDFTNAGRVDEPAVEALLLTIVTLRGGEADLVFAAKGGACRGLLARMGISTESRRWTGESWGKGQMLGVTA